MARQHINGIELYYELHGDGDDTLVLVHGSWTDHLSWQLVTPILAERHRVLVYDRRGHSRSERPTTQGARRQDEDDLAALVEALDLAPVHLVGNSYGASISLGLAGRHGELVHSVIAHEPPLLGVARPDTALAATADQVHATLDNVADKLRAGDLECGTRHFIEAVLGPGTWQMLPDDSRRTFIANAAAFLDTIGDPHWDAPPEPTDVPLLLTDGDASPIWLPYIVAELAVATYPHASRHTFNGAGHIPHITHPGHHAASVTAFIAAVSQATTTEGAAR
jgi:pimeloyl-ACP methyl ester carboxylesterase